MASTTIVPRATGIAPTPFALTTTFTAPTQCAQSVGGLTMLKNREFQIWLNEPEPVPGTTISSCYPPQFMSSYVLEQGGVTQAAFSPLVCPQGYQTQGPFTSNYIACCPSGWDGLAPNSNAPQNRPAYSGTCFLNIYNVPIQVTAYDDSSIQASSIFTATDTLAQAYAYPYEGYAFGVANLAILTHSSTTHISQTTSSPASDTFSKIPAPFSSRISGGALAGVIIGAVLFTLLLVAGVSLLWRSRRDRLVQSESCHTPKMGWRDGGKGFERFPSSSGSSTEYSKAHSKADNAQMSIIRRDEEKMRAPPAPREPVYEMYAGHQSRYELPGTTKSRPHVSF